MLPMAAGGVRSECLLQVTSMIATGPKPPLSFNSSNDEAPIKLNIGGGMGAQPQPPE